MTKKRKRKLNIKNLLILIFIILIIIGLVVYLILKSNKKEEETAIKGPYDLEKFDMSKEYYTYEDEKYTSVVGIDISEHNDEIDFEAVKESGIEFAFIRIGWRGYSEGKIYVDKRFEEYYAGAKEAGLKVGVYFFSQAINQDETKEEADFVLETLNGRSLDLPIVYDFETIDYDEARTDNLTKEQVTSNAVTFLKTVSTKYDAMLYANLSLLKNKYEETILKTFPLWYAQYYTEPETLNDFKIWQYSETGSVNGIDGEADLNIMFINR